jgi:hypothetical protein
MDILPLHPPVLCCSFMRPRVLVIGNLPGYYRLSMARQAASAFVRVCVVGFLVSVSECLHCDRVKRTFPLRNP